MHEHSLVNAMIRQVATICPPEPTREIVAVRVEIGPLAGVEPALFAAAFERLAPGTVAHRARLIIDEVPLWACCASCDKRFTIDNFDFRCPDCRRDVKITSGDEVQLVSLSVREVPVGEEVTR
jgi:hydrogenase nickel incorporation protein HypA/HybF